ncbi:RAC-alpha serine/threonine-protein kinase-like [Xenopus laevis]|uniref:non-specific serine/threonine protein kinase n=1 Tax=Xenopus laevis TaxID=8355 RepID=A0A8J1M0Y9_XENLA|nr:RAC-alpha serine/threonine-protein kinase-like [Xenopus laevis]
MAAQFKSKKAFNAKRQQVQVVEKMFRRLRKALSKFFRPRRRENKSRKNDPPVQLPEIPEILLTEEPVKLPEYPVHAATPAVEVENIVSSQEHKDVKRNSLESVALKSTSDSISSCEAALINPHGTHHEKSENKETCSDQEYSHIDIVSTKGLVNEEGDRKKEENVELENETPESEELVSEGEVVKEQQGVEKETPESEELVSEGEEIKEQQGVEKETPESEELWSEGEVVKEQQGVEKETPESEELLSEGEVVKEQQGVEKETPESEELVSEGEELKEQQGVEKETPESEELVSEGEVVKEQQGVEKETPESEELVSEGEELKEQQGVEKETPESEELVSEGKDRKEEKGEENKTHESEELINDEGGRKDEERVKIEIETPKSEELVFQQQEKTKVSRTSIEDYDLQKLLGEGGFGKVYLAQHKSSKEKVAIKALKKEGLQRSKHVMRLKLEKTILEEAKREKNPFLVGLYASFQTKHHYCLAMDYCAGGELTTYMKPAAFPKETAVFYAGCVVLGLQFLHERHIIHRDIKPDNILLDRDGYARLADFGISKKTMGFDGRTCSNIGTCYYMAPEILYYHSYNKSVDWWALGVMIYQMLLHKVSVCFQ